MTGITSSITCGRPRIGANCRLWPTATGGKSLAGSTALDRLVAIFRRRRASAAESFHPAGMLEALERLVLRWTPLQRFVIRSARAGVSRAAAIARTDRAHHGCRRRLVSEDALILRRLLPHAALTIVDASAENLAVARQFLDDDVVFIRRGTVPT
jgi:hypothetical protein